jgi:cell division protein FtsL
MKKRKFKLTKILALFMIVYASCILVNQQIKINKIKSETITYQSELKLLQGKNQKLQDEVKMSKSEMYIEKLAREKLGLIKPGETPVINNK